MLSGKLRTIKSAEQARCQQILHHHHPPRAGWQVRKKASLVALLYASLILKFLTRIKALRFLNHFSDYPPLICWPNFITNSADFASGYNAAFVKTIQLGAAL